MLFLCLNGHRRQRIQTCRTSPRGSLPPRVLNEQWPLWHQECAMLGWSMNPLLGLYSNVKWDVAILSKKIKEHWLLVPIKPPPLFQTFGLPGTRTMRHFWCVRNFQYTHETGFLLQSTHGMGLSGWIRNRENPIVSYSSQTYCIDHNTTLSITGAFAPPLLLA